MRYATSRSWIARGVVTAATAGLVVTAAAPAMANEDDSTTAGPKNVILLIGDGMGYTHIDNANLYTHGQSRWQVASDDDGNVAEVGGTPTQAFETWDHVDMTTYDLLGSYDPEAAWTDFEYINERPTDSAAAGTAMATGQKVINGALGMDPDGNAIPNLTDRAVALGKSAGVVSSVPFSHATPAAFAAQNESRNNYHGIASQMINSDLSVILGAGHPMYDDDSQLRDEPRYGYIGESDYNRLRDGQTDWTFIESGAQFQEMVSGDVPDKLFGLAPVSSTLQQSRTSAVEGTEMEPFTTDFNEDVPTLEDMTAIALDVLGKNDDGFFVMVEGGAIDWTGHANDTARNIEETLDFNNSVDAAIAWVEENSSWDETMVIVTADHETGYLAGPDSEERWTVMTGIAGQTPNVGWYSPNHTNQLIPVFAKGAGTEELFSRARGEDPVRGAYLDNTDLANFLLDDLWAYDSSDAGDIPVRAEIPGAGQGGEPPVPGALVLSIDEGAAELANPRNVGSHLRLTGVLPTVSVTDSRPEAAGWSVTGQSSDLTSNGATVRADRLGWAPFIEAGHAAPGEVRATVQSGGAGLAVPATLGSAAGQARTGTAQLSADVVLEAPVDTRAGAYSGGVTISLFPQD